MSSANETILNVDLNSLEKNLNYFKSKLNPTTKIIGVIKAFAYGHGDINIAKKLLKLNIHALWVSDFEEGLILRDYGIKTNIIVANPGLKSYKKIIRSKLEVVIHNHKLLDLYVSEKNNINIHIKFNTGMNRYGFNKSDIPFIASKIKNNKHLKLKSICSHLAESEKKSVKTLSQIECFLEIAKEFQLILNKKIDKHILNSRGILNFPEHQLDAVRIGIGLYGGIPDLNLKQISQLSSVITHVIMLEKGDSVGYSGAFIAKKKMTIGIVPVGYADGFNRRLGNGVGSVIINKKECAIIGEISMDSFAVDITSINAKEGDLVEIFGLNLTVSDIAKKINTIPYEIYSTLNRRIKRIYC